MQIPLVYIAIMCVLFFLLILKKGLKIVPQQQAWIVERWGKYHRKLEAGLNLIIPLIDKVSYIHSLKEETIEIHKQTAITQDNVTLSLDGVLYVKIFDPVSSSYGITDSRYALTQLVQTTMRSEIGKIPLDRTFEERELLNSHIVDTVNHAATNWGITCLRYEIKDISMPDDIRKAMELQMTAERQKRARILESEGIRQAQINESEGKRQAEINIAEGEKQRCVLESEATWISRANRAKGEAEALSILTKVITKEGEKAIMLRLAQQYLEAFKSLAKESNTVLLPADTSNFSSVLGQAMGIFDSLKKKSSSKKLTQTLLKEQLEKKYD